MSELKIPETWAKCECEKLFKIIKGKKPRLFKEENGNRLPYLSAKYLRGGIANEFAEKNDKNSILIQGNDIFIIFDGSNSGESFFGFEGVLSSTMAKLEFENFLFSNYVDFFMKKNFNLFNGAKAGAAIPHFEKNTFNRLSFPIPPLKEQERIVKKIESCFSRIDDTEKALDETEELLKKYRASLLAKAFRGELVAQDPRDESAAELLKRIRTERKKNQDGKKKKSNDLAPIKEDEIPFQIPENWCWVRLGSIVDNHDGQRKPIKSEDRAKRQGEYPYYGASGIIDSYDSYIFDGEYLLISEDGANLLARSTPIAFIATGKFWVNNHAHIVKAKEITSNRFLELYFESINISKWVTGAAQPKFNQEKMNSVHCPLPPIREQQRIIERIESSVIYLNLTEEQITTKKKLLKQFKESILSKAFTGELVEQITEEGTGLELLEQILKEKEKEQMNKTEQKAKKATNSRKGKS